MHPRSTLLRRLALVLALTFLAAACGDDDDSGGDDASATTEAGSDGSDRSDGDGDACGLLERITELDDESEAILDDTLGPALASGDPAQAEAAFQDFLDAFVPFAEEKLPTLIDAYEELADVVPEDLRSDVLRLSAFTGGTLEGLAEAESVEDIEALFTDDPQAATEAGQATLRIDEYSRDTCDIVLAN